MPAGVMSSPGSFVRAATIASPRQARVKKARLPIPANLNRRHMLLAYLRIFIFFFRLAPAAEDNSSIILAI